eukprot:scaffold26609_cov59-Phaeocystis_antarctica.AAC.3
MRGLWPPSTAGRPSATKLRARESIAMPKIRTVCTASFFRCVCSFVFPLCERAPMSSWSPPPLRPATAGLRLKPESCNCLSFVAAFCHSHALPHTLSHAPSHTLSHSAAHGACVMPGVPALPLVA